MPVLPPPRDIFAIGGLDPTFTSEITPEMRLELLYARPFYPYPHYQSWQAPKTASDSFQDTRSHNLPSTPKKPHILDTLTDDTALTSDILEGRPLHSAIAIKAKLLAIYRVMRLLGVHVPQVLRGTHNMAERTALVTKFLRPVSLWRSNDSSSLQASPPLPVTVGVSAAVPVTQFTADQLLHLLQVLRNAYIESQRLLTHFDAVKRDAKGMPLPVPPEKPASESGVVACALVPWESWFLSNGKQGSSTCGWVGAAVATSSSKASATGLAPNEAAAPAGNRKTGPPSLSIDLGVVGSSEVAANLVVQELLSTLLPRPPYPVSDSSRNASVKTLAQWVVDMATPRRWSRENVTVKGWRRRALRFAGASIRHWKKQLREDRLSQQSKELNMAGKENHADDGDQAEDSKVMKKLKGAKDGGNEDDNKLATSASSCTVTAVSGHGLVKHQVPLPLTATPHSNVLRAGPAGPTFLAPISASKKQQRPRQNSGVNGRKTVHQPLVWKSRAARQHCKLLERERNQFNQFLQTRNIPMTVVTVREAFARLAMPDLHTVLARLDNAIVAEIAFDCEIVTRAARGQHHSAEEKQKLLDMAGRNLWRGWTENHLMEVWAWLCCNDDDASWLLADDWMDRMHGRCIKATRLYLLLLLLLLLVRLLLLRLPQD